MSKTCNICGLSKPVEDFSIVNKSKGYRRGACRPCHRAKDAAGKVSWWHSMTPKQKEAHREKAKQWREKNPAALKRSMRRSSWKQYGIDPDLAEAYFNAHDGKCEICGGRDRIELNMDHCHTTGKIRGMLCRDCNLMLGHAKDSIDILNAAIAYLNR